MYLNGEGTAMKIGYISDTKMCKKDYTKDEGKMLLERIAKYLDRGFAISNFENFVKVHQDDVAFVELLKIYGNFR